jgi:HEAT repeat protein
VIHNLDESTREFKHSLELLSVSAASYQRTRQLLSVSEIEWIYPHRRRFAPQEHVRELLVCSVLASYTRHNLPVEWFWLRNLQIKEAVEIFDRAQQEPNASVRAVFEEVLPHLGDDELEFLIDVAEKDRCRLGRAARNAIAGLGPSAQCARLTKLCGHPDLELRYAAVSALQSCGRQYRKFLHERLLVDESRKVQSRALESIAQNPTACDMPALKAIALSADTPLAKDAIYTLGEIRSARIPRVLKSLFNKSKSPAVRRVAAECLAKRERSKLRGLVNRWSKDKDWRLRVIAAEVLPFVEQSTDQLGRLLLDRTHSVRRAAALSLGESSDPAAIAHLIEMIDSVESADALEALSRSRNPDAFEILKKTALSSNVDNRWATRLIANLGTPASIRALAAVVETRHELKEEALDFIARQDSDAAVPELVRLLHSENKALRFAAMRSLKGAQELETDEILDFLCSRNAETRWAAWIALPPTFVLMDANLVQKALRHARLSERNPILTVVSRQTDPAARPALRVLAEKGPEDQRAIAIRALSRFGKIEDLDFLLEFLNDTKSYVVETTVRGLGNFSDLRALSALKTVVFHDAPQVREAAAGALAKVLSTEELELFYTENETQLAATVREQFDFVLYAPEWWRKGVIGVGHHPRML